MQRIATHLMFDGQCREAFETYRRLLGGTLRLLSYGESPMAADVEEQWHERIVHATLDIGEVELAGADVLPHQFRKPQGFCVILGVDTVDEGKRLFDALADGGKVEMPFTSTFWSPGFGVLVDRFAIPWEVNVAGAP
jgi:PhnB protein